MNVAIIPARGGSKRIPRKNIKPFCGKPIIAYSIEAAIKSKLFDKVVVSTEDDEIASVAKFYGAEIPFKRPLKLADDYAGTGEVVRHAVLELSSKVGWIDFVCCIYATAPFVSVETLLLAWNMLIESKADQVFTVASFPYPIQRALRVEPDNHVSMFEPKFFHSRSQDLEVAYHDAGQIYWAKATAIIDNIPIFGPTSRVIMLPRFMVQDIDTEEDWTMAELMFTALKIRR